MSSLVIIGAQWGDEGKGKIVDLLSQRADVIARFNGGDNAGHTIILKGGDKVALHLIPSGIFHEGKACVIGNGVVVNPKSLVEEMEYIVSKGVKPTRERLLVSEKAHLIMPYHLKLEEYKENSLSDKKIGTTKKGIGPAYEDKIARSGFMVGDLKNRKHFKEKLSLVLPYKNSIIERVYGGTSFDMEEIFESYLKYYETFEKNVCKTSLYMDRALKEGKNILFEGAQGTFLDVDHGTYPFVTSSNTVSAEASIGTGIGPKLVGRILGVFKAYVTRVGSGPFPTELSPSVAETLRKKGNEFGATTGRPRRCGWLDMPLLRQAIRVNGIESLCINKLDVLSGFPRIKICTGYKLMGETAINVDLMAYEFESLEPVYEELEGWEIFAPEKIKKKKDLPKNALTFLERVEQEAGVPIDIVSLGPNREQTLVIKEPF